MMIVIKLNYTITHDFLQSKIFLKENN